ncbi:MAG: MBOAT family protein [Micavibrio sp.]|nr:MBOAT family protein [Micavibrio sp.]
MWWLVVASLFFYGWFKPVYLLILLASLLLNYPLGMALAQKPWCAGHRRGFLVLGIAANLAALFYYKYTGLFLRTLNAAGAGLTVPDIILPLGISFFTFQKIAWLVDSFKRKTSQPDFLHYALFITFFPQLIAGPIVHHSEVIPQFTHKLERDPARRLMAMGLTVFIIGLFKKVIIADSAGDIADPIFNAASTGVALNMAQGWLGALSYSLQIYFDFSGYSDMAIGLAGLFGIRLPLNFFAPYKSADIITFWRRWHMTLSRFLRDYLYIPLGGNRYGDARRYAALLVTMLLGGLWHGANWTFLVWGGIHALYLMINHGWRRLSPARLPKPLAVVITFASTVAAWVLFRADSLDTGLHMLSAMAGGGLALAWEPKLYLLTAAFIGMFILPTTHELMQKNLALDAPVMAETKPVKLVWQPSITWALGCAVMAAASLLMLTRVHEFIYFRF